jgi:hypothetical protein
MGGANKNEPNDARQSFGLAGTCFCKIVNINVIIIITITTTACALPHPPRLQTQAGGEVFSHSIPHHSHHHHLSPFITTSQQLHPLPPPSTPIASPSIHYQCLRCHPELANRLLKHPRSPIRSIHPLPKPEKGGCRLLTPKSPVKKANRASMSNRTRREVGEERGQK